MIPAYMWHNTILARNFYVSGGRLSLTVGEKGRSLREREREEGGGKVREREREGRRGGERQRKRERNEKIHSTLYMRNSTLGHNVFT